MEPQRTWHMVDLAPRDAISLSDFYRRFLLWRWNGNNAFEQLDLEGRVAPLPGERILEHRSYLDKAIDSSYREAVRLFKLPKLRAFVQPGDFKSRRYFSARAWEQAFFPERLLMADVIAAGHGDEFDAAIDRTPFVDERHVEECFAEVSGQKDDWTFSWALREVVIALVMHGVMLEGEADTFAKSWGLPPLTSQPPPEKYDPRKSAAWTLPMVVTWIVWRRFDAVRETMDDYRAHWWDWYGVHRRLPIKGGTDWYEVEGSELRRLEPQTIFTLGLYEATGGEAYDGPVTMSVKSAREQLWANLTEGLLAAAGLNAIGQVVQIPAHEWPYIELQANDHGADRLVFKAGSQPAYRDVTIRQSSIVETWPPIPSDERTYQFDYSAPQWSLLEASRWVGSGGRSLTDQQIADDDIDDRGAKLLFEAFNGGELVATALNRQRVREPIPAEYWELATIDPELHRERHYVSFLDEILREEGGQMTRYGEHDPHWFGIKVTRDALLSAFPNFIRPEGIASTRPRTRATGAKSDAAEEALRALYGDSDIPKGLTQKELLTKVNAWLKEKGGGSISERTLQRALQNFTAAK